MFTNDMTVFFWFHFNGSLHMTCINLLCSLQPRDHTWEQSDQHRQTPNTLVNFWCYKSKLKDFVEFYNLLSKFMQDYCMHGIWLFMSGLALCRSFSSPFCIQENPYHSNFYLGLFSNYDNWHRFLLSLIMLP